MIALFNYIGAILLSSSSLYFIITYAFPLIPIYVFELIMYSLALILVFNNCVCSHVYSYIICVIGDILLYCMLWYSIGVHHIEYNREYVLLITSAFLFLQTLYWKCNILGLFTIMFLLYSVLDVQHVNNITLLLICIYGYLQLSYFKYKEYVELFDIGILICCNIIFSISSFALDTKTYVFNSVLSLFKFLAIYYFGHNYNELFYLKYISGISSILFICHKLYEMTWTGILPFAVFGCGLLSVCLNYFELI